MQAVAQHRPGNATWQRGGEFVEALRPEHAELTQDEQAPSVSEVLDCLCEGAIAGEVARPHATHAPTGIS
jgi:hypothetical protein